MTLSVYILWFSNVYVSNVVFVIPSPSNLLPLRPCQSPTLGSPPLPYSVVFPDYQHWQSHDRCNQRYQFRLASPGRPLQLVQLFSSVTISPTCYSGANPGFFFFFFLSYPSALFPVTPKDHTFIPWTMCIVLQFLSSTAQFFFT